MEILFLVLIIAAGVAVLPFVRKENAFRVAFAVSGAAFLYSLFLAYMVGQQGFLEFTVPWVPAAGISFSFYLDGLSIPLVVLTALLITVVTVYSAKQKKEPSFFFFLIFLTGLGVTGVFTARDLFLFIFFWEIVLIPMFFVILNWGGEKRRHAAFKFLIYTHLGSLIMVIGIFMLYTGAWELNGYPSFMFDDLLAAGFSAEQQAKIFLVVFIGLAVKMPIVPLHTWLPEAHVEAPAAGSAVLAGLLLKMGGYGLFRIGFELLPAGVSRYAGFLMVLAVINVVFGGFVAFSQTDIKKMIAYSSISHMGFVLAGLAAMNYEGILGGVYQMVGHGLISGSLFLICGVVEYANGTRIISRLGMLGNSMPKLTLLMGAAFCASMGLPGFAGFTGEFTVMAGVYRSFGSIHIGLIFTGILISVAYYMLCYGKIALRKTVPVCTGTRDMYANEFAAVSCLVLLAFAAGIFPDFVFDFLRSYLSAVSF